MAAGSDNAPPDRADPDKGERIAKVIARAGAASRRGAEEIIRAGRVAVNGTAIDSPALNVVPADLVTIDGTPLPQADRTRLWRYHKPPGLITAHRDPAGRPTVFDRLPGELPRVISVGRLDLTSEGLLLLTNDGALARRLELPKTGWKRRYRVRVYGRIAERDIVRLGDGMTIDGIRYGPIQVAVEKEGANSWLAVSLAEGKNREIRKVMTHLGLPVSRLIRTAFGPFQLGRLPRGAVDEISGKVLKEQLGIKA